MNRREALAALVALPKITRISKAKVQPTDVIVFECDYHISSETAARITEAAKTVWPNNQVLVLTEGLRIKVVSQ